jgi:hypothetical protein
MEKPALTKVSLSNVRVIMMIYVCFYGGVSVSGGDGMDSSTQVPVIRCAWVPVAMSYRDRNLMPLFPEYLAIVALPSTEKAPRQVCRGPGTYRAGSCE